MIKLLLFLLLAPLLVLAHPGIGIVRDSRGNIYYSDLQQVWKITGGQKSIAVPGVHSHELYIDAADNLYGEHVHYDGADKFYHYQWVLRPNGDLDTVSPLTQAYITQDYSLARDRQGAEYYVRQFIRRPDTNHIYKRTPDGRETVFARGNFKGVGWLHPQEDGSLLFVRDNNVYRAHIQDGVTVLARGIASHTPSFAFAGNNPIVYGAWQDDSNNVYVAVFSDQAIKKIDTRGVVTTYYTATGNWAPTQGIFDGQGRLWVLESSDQNEVRVVLADPPTAAAVQLHGRTYYGPWLIAVCIVLALILAYRVRKGRKRLAA